MSSTRTSYRRPGGSRSIRRGLPRSRPRGISRAARGLGIPGRPQPLTASSLPAFQDRDSSQSSSSDHDPPAPGTPAGSSSLSTRASTPSSLNSDGISLESVFDMCRSTLAVATTISTRLSKVEENNGKLTTSVKELKEYMKKFCKTSFVVKGSQYEAPIKSKMAKLFCLSLKRKPSDKDIQEAVNDTLGTCDSGEKYKYDMVFTYAKNKLTEYRTEERRKVVGLPPYEKFCYYNTKDLHYHIIGYMQASLEEDDRATYVKHLAILRKFVRDNTTVPSTNFYGAFREWLNAYYPALTSDTWIAIREEDEGINYSEVGSGIQNYDGIEEVISEEEAIFP